MAREAAWARGLRCLSGLTRPSMRPTCATLSGGSPRALVTNVRKLLLNLPVMLALILLDLPVTLVTVGFNPLVPSCLVRRPAHEHSLDESRVIAAWTCWRTSAPPSWPSPRSCAASFARRAP